ncbi:hypothetical protein, partial [Coleofasciculus sp.]|uniref:hypothetical protein n=1 Tax=Coleofasciculus sp. TaxID=3100458 RepID=UPI003A48E56E
VYIQLVFPASGNSSLREPYGDWVSAAESTPLIKLYAICPKIEPNIALKPFPSKPSTPLDGKYRVSAIWRLVSICRFYRYLIDV